MSNPFDQFASDFRAAVPQVGAPSPMPMPPAAPADGYLTNTMAQSASAPTSIMNAPQMQHQQQPPAYQMSGAGGMYAQPPPPMPQQQRDNALVPSAVPSNPYGGFAGFGGAPQLSHSQQQPPSMVFGAPPPIGAAPGGPPPLVGAYGQPPHPTQQLTHPLPQQAMAPSSGSFRSSSGSFGEVPHALAPVDPYSAPPAPAAPNMYGAPPPAPPVTTPPAPIPAPAPPAYNPAPFGEPAAGAIVPSAAPPSDDPFGIFGSSGPIVAAPAPTPAPMPSSSNDDIFGLGFSAPPTDSVSAAPAVAHAASSSSEIVTSGPSAPAPASGSMRQSGDLPPGGEWYDARIFTPTLGVMFFKPQELTDSLFLQTDKTVVEGLDERPVVAFIVEGSSARSAGVELGHVLLKVNGIDVKNPKDASRLIKEGPRPLPLLFYVPDTTVVVAEGEHMVKYDTRETSAPNSAKDWKPKYVVIGGIIAQPWMMNMYRSKVRTFLPCLTCFL